MKRAGLLPAGGLGKMKLIVRMSPAARAPKLYMLLLAALVPLTVHKLVTLPDAAMQRRTARMTKIFICFDLYVYERELIRLGKIVVKT